MPFALKILPHTLRFKFDARTSRGAMQQHQVYFFLLQHSDYPNRVGVGECAPLPGLSPEYHAGFGQDLERLAGLINAHFKETEGEALAGLLSDPELARYPSVIFALETAWLDWQRGGERKLFDSPFSRGESGIPINGLVWMGEADFMQGQIRQKLEEGYSCLKLKIGGLDFATELKILASVRRVASGQELSIRLDANGAFAPAEAMARLEALATYQIQSIEQPIRAGNAAEMARLAVESPIPVALDEELIGVQTRRDKINLLDQIHPPYIILKPTLAGGIASCRDWIELAEERQVGWWMTSALESNIGLNAISQFTATYPVQLPQGLGTGQLYHNNIPSPLTIRQGCLYYEAQQGWEAAFWETLQ